MEYLLIGMGEAGADAPDNGVANKNSIAIIRCLNMQYQLSLNQIIQELHFLQKRV